MPFGEAYFLFLPAYSASDVSTQQVRYQVSRGVAVVNDAIPLAIAVVRVMYGELFVCRSVGILTRPESTSGAANFRHDTEEICQGVLRDGSVACRGSCYLTSARL